MNVSVFDLFEPIVGLPSSHRSTVRASIEHVFARQKDQMALFICTIGIARAETKVTLANLAYDMDRLIFHERRAAMG